MSIRIYVRKRGSALLAILANNVSSENYVQKNGSTLPRHKITVRNGHIKLMLVGRLYGKISTALLATFANNAATKNIVLKCSQLRLLPIVFSASIIKGLDVMHHFEAFYDSKP